MSGSVAGSAPLSTCRRLEDKLLRRRVAGAVQITAAVTAQQASSLSAHTLCVCECVSAHVLSVYIKHWQTMAPGPHAGL